MEDAILKEVWATKDRIAARYRGNIKKYMKDLRKAHVERAESQTQTHRPAGKAKRKSA